MNEYPIAGLPATWREPLTAITYVRRPAREETAATGYGLRALEGELERLLRAQPGQRNEALNT